MKVKNLFIVLLSTGLFLNCNGSNLNIETTEENVPTNKETYPEANLTKAYFASGCFWCVEAIFESVNGVQEAISGYAGGHTKNPTYREIGSGTTGHTETVEVIYDSTLVSFNTLLEVFYDSQDPTTVGQRPDFGSQYRSAIFYTTANEQKLAEAYKEMLAKSGKYNQPIATEIVALDKFWTGEDYHQDYERLHPNESYIRNVSIPRLKRFQAKHPELLKKGH
ncbi:MAG: peptide-methionine (S)-S-oxide reductase [Patiriisocius sp.]|jgi:peptide-methionine (S)-S-oxide reductase